MISEEPNSISGAPVQTVAVFSIDKVLPETINNILENIFGKKGKESLLHAMEKRYSLKRGEILDNVQGFADALHEILGSGSVIIEDLILETVYAKLNVEFEWKKDYRFSDYVNEVRIITKKVKAGSWLTAT